MSYLTRVAWIAVLIVLHLSLAGTAAAQPVSGATQMKIFLDCDACYGDYLQTEVAFVDYVRDRTEAEVHVLITRAQTASGGSEYTLAFVGLRRFQGVDDTLRTVTESSDTDDIVRRQLATSVRAGLLRYLTRDAVPPRLEIDVAAGTEGQRPAVVGDRFNNWVFSVRGSASFQGEESSRARELGLSLSADRITPDWKITIGSDLEHETEEFDLDEDEPVRAERRERDLNWLLVKALGEHWSAGAQGEIESSTFDNTELLVAAAPAVEYNFFPYSQYTRRQLRVLYAAGVQAFDYYEVTLYGKREETLPYQELSLTLEQREEWGSIEAGLEWSQVLARPRQEQARGVRRALAPGGPRPVGGGRSQRLPYPRPALHPGSRGD